MAIIIFPKYRISPQKINNIIAKGIPIIVISNNIIARGVKNNIIMPGRINL